MKQIFYKGLLALTIAFGFTSCDKNDVGDSNLQLTAADAKDNNFIHKVSFAENGLFAPIKGQSDAASKNAAEFAGSHIYAETPQMLVISKGTGDDKVVAYSGIYTAGDISSLDPANIILGNGSYSAVSTNDSGLNESIVTGFASYSSMVDFDLSESGSIALAVTHDRGFVIADSQRAIEGTRITSVILSSGELSGNLILDESDSLNDFYGYLIAGTYDVVINYTLNDVEASKTGSVVIANGVASTLLPVLIADDLEPVVTSETTTLTESSTEVLAEEDVNGDDDLLDTVSRLVSSTITTTGGEAAPAVLSYGEWTLVSDIDISVGVSDEESTELAITTNINPDFDSDQYDTITRVVTTTTESVDGTAGTPVIVPGAWSILENLHSATPSEDSDLGDETTTESGVTTRTTRLPLASTEADLAIANPDRADGGDINRDGDLLDTITRFINTLYTTTDGTEDAGVITSRSPWSIVVNNAPVVAANAADEFIYSAFVGEATDIPASRIVSGTAGSLDEVVADSVEFFTRTITTPRENVVDAYSYEQTRTVSIQVNDAQDDPALDLADADSLTQTVEVAESRTAAADDVQTEEVLNPNYAPAAEFVAGTVTVTAGSLEGTYGITGVAAPNGDAVAFDAAAGTFTSTVAGEYTISIFHLVLGAQSYAVQVGSGDVSVALAN